MTSGDSPGRTDKYGNPLSAYPSSTEYGDLLGFNAVGNAVYATERTITLAVLGPDGALRIPPMERWLSTDFPLEEVEMGPSDYVLYSADETGLWRALTETGRDGVEALGVDPDQTVGVKSVDADPDALMEKLTGGTEAEQLPEAAGELKTVVMNDPQELVPYVDELLRLLVSTDVPKAAGAESSADHPVEYDEYGLTRNVAYAIARIARSEPAEIGTHFEHLVHALGKVREPADTTLSQDYLLDTFDILGRSAAVRTSRRVRSALEDGDTSLRVATLNSLSLLEHRYATEEHPLLEHQSVREAIQEAETDASQSVREAAKAVTMVHDFHR